MPILLSSQDRISKQFPRSLSPLSCRGSALMISMGRKKPAISLIDSPRWREKLGAGKNAWERKLFVFVVLLKYLWVLVGKFSQCVTYGQNAWMDRWAFFSNLIDRSNYQGRITCQGGCSQSSVEYRARVAFPPFDRAKIPLRNFLPNYIAFFEEKWVALKLVNSFIASVPTSDNTP